MNQTQYINI